MVLSSCVSIRDGGIHGHCWFAGRDIKAGELIWELGTTHYNDITITKSELATWPAEKREKFMSLAYMSDGDHYKGSDPSKTIPQSEQDEYFVNHSCDGNCWYLDDDHLVAMRDIKKDEELTYDYALTECDPDWTLAPKCLCGKKACRGLVTGNDWKLPKLQQLYTRHFLPHILNMIDNDKATSSKENVESGGECCMKPSTKKLDSAASTSSPAKQTVAV